MATTYSVNFDLLLAKYQDARIAWQNAATYWSYAYDHWTLSEDHLCLQDLLSSVSYVRQAINFLTTYYSSSWPYYQILNLLRLDFEYTYQNTTDLPLAMPQIINAMLTATFDQLTSFIGIEDAYRVALWNAPFNANFYGALARGFSTWGR